MDGMVTCRWWFSAVWQGYSSSDDEEPVHPGHVRGTATAGRGPSDTGDDGAPTPLHQRKNRKTSGQAAAAAAADGAVGPAQGQMMPAAGIGPGPAPPAPPPAAAAAAAPLTWAAILQRAGQVPVFSQVDCEGRMQVVVADDVLPADLKHDIEAAGVRLVVLRRGEPTLDPRTIGAISTDRLIRGKSCRPDAQGVSEAEFVSLLQQLCSDSNGIIAVARPGPNQGVAGAVPARVVVQAPCVDVGPRCNQPQRFPPHVETALDALATGKGSRGQRDALYITVLPALPQQLQVQDGAAGSFLEELSNATGPLAVPSFGIGYYHHQPHGSSHYMQESQPYRGMLASRLVARPLDDPEVAGKPNVKVIPTQAQLVSSASVMLCAAMARKSTLQLSPDALATLTKCVTPVPYDSLGWREHLDDMHLDGGQAGQQAPAAGGGRGGAHAGGRGGGAAAAGGGGRGGGGGGAAVAPAGDGRGGGRGAPWGAAAAAAAGGGGGGVGGARGSAAAAGHGRGGGRGAPGVQQQQE